MKKFNPGIMQGRLVPRYKGRYQAFPKGYWEAEFPIARALGLGHIEFILDFEDADSNPLMSLRGVEQIKKVALEHSVAVKSICADYFMLAPLHREGAAAERSEQVLSVLIDHANSLGVRDIVIPCVDASSLRNETEKASLVAVLARHLPQAEKAGINLNLETDLDPKSFRDLLDRFSSPNIKVNYDIGNSASLGFDPVEELSAYGTFVSDLHVKDRLLGKGSVRLGTGHADFDKVMTQLVRLGFEGTITLQASRAEDYVDDLVGVRSQLQFTRDYFQKYFN